jgi:FkbH-like protein
LSVAADSQSELDYQRLLKAGRRLSLPDSAPRVRLALLADCAVQQLAALLTALLGRAGIRAEIYQAAFDAIELESRVADSPLYRFAPDVVVVLNTAQALRALHSGVEPEFESQRLQRIVAVWDAIERHSQATILQSTFAIPPDSLYGNYDLSVATSLRATAQQLNAAITAASRDRVRVRIHDVENTASWVGRRQFFDECAWDLWKAPCALEHLPRLARNIADVVLAQRGRIVKCVVSDLDNTLWGGVIGDDGLEGIALSAHGGGAGESFVRMQRFLKQLSQRGVLLAVCSKNNESAALSPFLEHPDMVLRREDIAVFVANWDDKASGLRRIQATLNIGLDSMVFLDDNPFERNLVRELLPEVIVPELPEDPANFVAALSDLNLFETAQVSDEDRQRAVLYQREARRRDAAAVCTSVEDYLRSLDMRATVTRFDRFHLPRIAQLMQRSNQFNLRTRRLSEAQCAALAEDAAFLPLYASLSDRLGDHGLISVVVLERCAQAVLIRDWLMSCRVLGRGVEQLLMNHVVAHGRELGVSHLVGEYVPTTKNGMVREFFAQFGFTRGATENEWVLELAAYQPTATFIRLVESASLHGSGTEVS